MRDKRRNGEAGIALVLALLSLMLLTFLGLALAATTSTELQIANNYRWSQQAYYNAEAGLEVAKKLLGGVDNWASILPDARPTATWKPDGSTPQTPPSISTPRDFENSACDGYGGNFGYGRVLDVGGVQYNDVSQVTIDGETQRVRGAFTIWVRRQVVMAGSEDGTGMTGLMAESRRQTIVITAEGVAPYRSVALGRVAEQNQAVRTMEAVVTRDQSIDICQDMDSGGDGFARCRSGDPDGTGNRGVRGGGLTGPAGAGSDAGGTR